MCVAGRTLCDPLLTRAISERFRDEQLIIMRCTNKVYFTLSPNVNGLGIFIFILKINVTQDAED